MALLNIGGSPAPITRFSNNMDTNSMSLRPSTISKRTAAAAAAVASNGAEQKQHRSCHGSVATVAAYGKRLISSKSRQQQVDSYFFERTKQGRNNCQNARRRQKDCNGSIVTNINCANSNNSIDDSIKSFSHKLNINRQHSKDDDEFDSDFSSLSCDELHSNEGDKKDEMELCDLKVNRLVPDGNRKHQQVLQKSSAIRNKSLSSSIDLGSTAKRIKGSNCASTTTTTTTTTTTESRGKEEKEELVCSCGHDDWKRRNSKKNEALEPSPNHQSNNARRSLVQPHKLVRLIDRNQSQSICNKHMPWFGIDVGGTLVKVVFFDPKDATREETTTLKRIRRYLRSSKAYGTTGKRDAHLEMPNCVINKRIGTLHFIRFATNQMPQFLAMAKTKGFADTINTVCATGGGANMFEEDIKKNLGITLHKTDELDSIIHGINYIDKHNSLRECYFLEDPLNDEKCVKVPYDFSRPYPYLVVNIGSGVSILAVYSSRSYSRISGSSIGGGTFLGLCSLLTQCKTFDEAIRLAKAGSSVKIDKLVKDIYGGDYIKFNLSGDTVASSFGHMNIEDKRKNVKREDLARALLEMVTTNIGSIARMCAANENIDRVVFIGNFLRVNQLSMKLLSYAVNYWSKGAIKALFLEHEGYFGAVGCFVESTQGCNMD